LFSPSRGTVRAVDGVSFDLHAGEILGVIGESGCGKSSLARTILRLDRPTGGQVLFRDNDVQQLKGETLALYRRSVQAVFQDPYSSLNPRMSVLEILCEPWELNPGVLEKREWRNRGGQLLEQVGLTPADLDKYPGEFSGGQRQRIAIARALALSPSVLVCDEAVSALDMIIQRQVMQLLAELRDRLGLAYVFIAHDLHLVRDFADRVLVMRHGKVVESGRTADVFAAPQSDYARLLLADFGSTRQPA
jgi:peptide/nickel transport system ATP-binding protein